MRHPPEPRRSSGTGDEVADVPDGDSAWHAALEYARLGYAVFPLHTVRDGACSCGKDKACSSAGKHPRTKRGFKDASCDPAVINSWWRKWPDANVGIATGSTLFVLDVDAKSGGMATIAALEDEHGPLPTGPRVVSGGGGRHDYFAAVPGARSRTGIASGIDVRAEGGYIVAPPSVHGSGRRYRWDGLPLVSTSALAAAPLWLINLAQGGRAVAAKKSGTKVVERAARHIEAAPEGTRNETLNREAFMVGKNARRCGIDPSNATKSLIAAGVSSGLSEAESATTAQRAISAGVAAERSTTDTALAERLADAVRDELRFISDSGSWIRWNGRHWEACGAEVALEHTKSIARAHADPKLESAYRRKAVVGLLAAESQLWTPQSELDSHPMLLNVQNGTIDLQTGETLPHAPEHYLTQICATPFHANATCPTWLRVLERVLPDPEVRGYVQRLFACALTGDVSDQVVTIFHGGGQNGKSTILNTGVRLMGSYAMQAPRHLLLRKREQDQAALADLRGKRLVVATETAPGEYLDEPQLKLISGGERIRARHLYQNYIEFEPTHHIVLAVNTLPRIGGTDDGIWRRIRVVPFTVRLPDAALDRALPDRLLAEAPGILRWAVDGLQSWRAMGLASPPAVAQATEEYRRASDVVRSFIAECTVHAPAARVAASKLFRAFVEWAEANGSAPGTQTAFGTRIADLGYERRKTGGTITYIGFRLVEPPYDVPAPAPDREGRDGCTPLSEARENDVSTEEGEYGRSTGSHSKPSLPSLPVAAADRDNGGFDTADAQRSTVEGQR